MLEKLLKLGTALVLVALGGACSSPMSDKSTGTNWISCKSDADCAGNPGTHCGLDSWCVPVASARGGGGAPDRDGGAGSGGTSSGGASSGGASSGSASSGSASSGSASSGGASDGASDGGTSSGGAPDQGGGPGNGGTGNGGTGPTTGCYSPEQGQSGIDILDPGAIGCKCTVSLAPLGVCTATSNNGWNAFLCQNGNWLADQQQRACAGCWTPDQPEFAHTYPNHGCACVNENETACIATQSDGYANAVCRGGTWKLDGTINACTCTSDVRCGFGGKCVIPCDGGTCDGAGTCAHRQCEVDGIRYAVGVSGIPSPFDCNTCECGANGELTCTSTGGSCPQTVCDAGTTLTSTCVGCGLAGGCALTRYGCLPRCASSTDCAGTGTPVCDATTHVCSAGPCP